MRKIDRGLTAEGNDHAYGLFNVYYVHDVLKAKRLKIEPVGCVEVGGDGFGVVIDDNDLVAQLLERFYAVDRAVIKFNALTDADRSAAENYYSLLFALDKGASLTVPVKGRVKIRRFSSKLRGTGIDHFINRDRLIGNVRAGDALKRLVGISEIFAVLVALLVKSFFREGDFKVGKVFQPV